ncbi:uncharacterized protein [Rutidosis leptorrhynchoides]|uniref:uncharacterized protein n=1 Tax=Rutidosis leptorrhynchoides TaxID=125765 RepID=UPI003A992A27
MNSFMKVFEHLTIELANIKFASNNFDLELPKLVKSTKVNCNLKGRFSNSVDDRGGPVGIAAQVDRGLGRLSETIRHFIMDSLTKEFEHLIMELEKIKQATSNFDETEVIGEGGFGKVYKGEVSHYKGRSLVAVKRLDRNSKSGQGDPEFWKEVMMLSRYSHVNLISLLGYCNEAGERILVYEYASNGSLDRHLSRKSLSWSQRIKICLDAAKGLSYLHADNGAHQRVLHRDIKSANILLDDEWNAKVADMGLSKLGPANQQYTALVTGVAGTLGYVDPVYLQEGVLTKESDVYSFGVVLMEVLSGKRCLQKNKNGTFMQTWKKNLKTGQLDEILFQDVVLPLHPDSLQTFSRIAMKCLNKYREHRPLMSDVVDELEVALELQEPHDLKLPNEYEESKHKFIEDSQEHPFLSDGKAESSLIMDSTTIRDPFTEEFEHLIIELENIKLATKNFDETKCIESGIFWNVYKAIVTHYKGRSLVSVKRLDSKLGQGDNLEFWKDMMMYSRYSHENLISLLGYCNEADEKILVYEYAYNRSLGHHLSSKALSWSQRIKICLDAARGLSYLHGDNNVHKRVPHRDIKCSNILLDDEWNAKVSITGLSQLRPRHPLNTFRVTGFIDNIESLDPVYLETGILTIESDVYSFGVVLLEVLSGEKCHYTVKQASKKLFKTGRLDEIVFQGVMKPLHPESLQTFSKIAFQCLTKYRENRPLMSVVVRELEAALILQKPHDLKLPKE